MMIENLQLISIDLLETYLRQVPNSLKLNFDALSDAEISTESFSFYVSVSSVFSSKIEGETIELDSYIKHKKFGVEFLPDYTKKIDDLYDAYNFAQVNELNQSNIFEAHKLLSRNLLSANWQGKYRTQNMYVTTADGKIEYVAVSPYQVEIEMKKFLDDISILFKADLSVAEVFYFASLIHLVFVKIHPWNDGNGRTARLIEKWFLAQKIGPKAWFMQSEKMYYENHNSYYDNIRSLGLEYSELNYKHALPFLLMLPKTIT
jgi:Fic family protein